VYDVFRIQMSLTPESIWVERSLYRIMPTSTMDLCFYDLIERTALFSYVLQQASGIEILS
jgi:hypothetical protein